MSCLFPALDDPPAKPALHFGDQILDYPALRSAALTLAETLRDQSRVAVWATPTPGTAVGVVAALLAGVPVVPLNPRGGARELAHVVGDSEPSLVLAEPGAELPPALDGLPVVTVTAEAPGGDREPPAAPAVDPEQPALVVYTSGTTGPPKGVLLSRRAVATTLDALADAWAWTEADVVVHGLPLFHVHGLVLGVLGPLRRGGTVRHLGRFSPDGVRAALTSGGTVLFGVPTMYHRLAGAAEGDAALAEALAGARLLVSGSAPLPLTDHERIWRTTGRRVVERYGMTETLMNTSVRADGPPATGTVGVALPGVEVRLVDEAGRPLDVGDAETVGEIQVRGPNLFSGYLNQPEATAGAFDAEGWFRTGDVATRDSTGGYRIVGRRSTDLIKSGGYKIGAGEIENVLLAHPEVAEAAVTAGPDADLGERVVAWVVPRDAAHPPTLEELSEHVVGQLAAHKRPREVRFLAALPRNELGKVLKRELA
ncbi:malonyl-CoA/methylmalonyl-CoA synthetase [Streptomyces zhaozhouensis]|uniref:Malonyl-CoA/methylmalonyl-CoA synthetase n=1 Tax=Streptomyces zhaozhouensis TaxID=1300267 RepID=A0A286DVX8_9ACTN|nr:acyl-CoA synthetase [Streptomyces zhaozhouensis]SOD62714.1 malonyl-CoA/methylmalonyl-CoA synthetase [Streptomyces zhaozhouensis]